MKEKGNLKAVYKNAAMFAGNLGVDVYLNACRILMDLCAQTVVVMKLVIEIGHRVESRQ